jgi:hypothetical protein
MPVDRAHRNIRRIEARLSPVNPQGEEDGSLYRPRGMRQATFERLWEELDRNEDVLNERLVRVVARLMKRVVWTNKRPWQAHGAATEMVTQNGSRARQLMTREGMNVCDA